MTITRRSLHDEISRLDAEIEELQREKGECFAAYRFQMQKAGESKSVVAEEIAACKRAFRRLRALDKDADSVLEQDALVDAIIAELQKSAGTERATRAPRARPSSSVAVVPSRPAGDGEAAAAVDTPAASSLSEPAGLTPPSPSASGGAALFRSSGSAAPSIPDDLSIPGFLRRSPLGVVAS